MARRPESVISFVKMRLEALGLSARDFDRKTGDKFSNLTTGRQKPPLATLHKWADALQLDHAGRMHLLLLADEAHGGGTIASWIVEVLTRLENDPQERDRLMAELVSRNQHADGHSKDGHSKDEQSKNR